MAFGGSGATDTILRASNACGNSCFSMCLSMKPVGEPDASIGIQLVSSTIILARRMPLSGRKLSCKAAFPRIA